MLELVTPAEAASELRVSLGTIYNLIRSGRVPSIRLGGQWRIRRGDLDAAAAGEFATSPVSVPASDNNSGSHPPTAPLPLAKRGPHPNDGWVTEQRR